MKGTFKVVDGEPYVITKKKQISLKLINVQKCSVYNIGPKIYESIQTWNIVPFSDKNFWSEEKRPPVLIQGQEIRVETVENELAKVIKIKG